MKELLSEYKKNKPLIKKRLSKFKNLHKGPDNDVFSELCFCLLTPQSKAVHCDAAIQELKKTNLLYRGNKDSIRKKLNRVRFPNNKTNFLIEARNVFMKGNCLNVKNKLDLKNIQKTREWLVKNIKGLGYKEASHFLRNIGLGKSLAILDIHILRNLKNYGVIKEIPSSISKYNYLAIEKKLKIFSKKIKIPMEELDLLFWAKETGFVFK